MKPPRAPGVRSRYEILDRDGTLTACGHAIMTELLTAAHVPRVPAFDAMLITGEALTNAERYGAGRRVQIYCAVTNRHVLLELEYQTAWFDDNPPLPDWTCVHGRGIRLMRGLTGEAGGVSEWRFRRRHDGDYTLRLVLLLKYR